MSDILNTITVVEYLRQWRLEGQSANALLAFIEGGASPLKSDGGLTAKLDNVLAVCTVKTLKGLCYSGTIAAIAEFLNGVAKDGNPNFGLLSGIPDSKLWQSSDCYKWLKEGVVSPTLAKTLEGGKDAAEKKAATAAKRNATMAAKKEAAKATSNPHVMGIELDLEGKDALNMAAILAAISGMDAVDLAALSAAIGKREAALAASQEAA